MPRRPNPLHHLALKALVASPAWPPLLRRHPERTVRLYWQYKMGYPLDLTHPRTLNEKIQWLKLNGPAEQWTQYADKLAFKQLMAEQGLEAYLPRTLAVYGSADEVDFEVLPESFVLKCNHDCGSAHVVASKSALGEGQRRRIVACLRRHLRRPYGYRTAEPHYLPIERRILAEEMLGTPDDFCRSSSLTDYKFWCFNGHAEVCLVCYDRDIGHRHAVKDLYALSPWRPWREGLAEPLRHQPFVDQPEPPHLDEMVALAETLSKGHPQVRVDLYNIGGRIAIGELTFTASSGIMRSLSPDMQLRLGDLTDLRLLRRP